MPAVKRMLAKEVKMASEIGPMLTGDFTIVRKPELLGYLANNQEKTKESLSELLKIIKSQIKSIGKYMEWRDKTIKIGVRLRDVFLTEKLFDDVSLILEKEILEKTRRAFNEESDKAVLEAYKQLVGLTLQQDKIANNMFQDQAESLNTETIDKEVLGHFLINLQKQKALIDALIKQPRSDPNGINRRNEDLNKLRGLFEEEKRFHAILIRDEKLVISLEEDVLLTLTKKIKIKYGRKAMFNSLRSQAFFGIGAGLIIMFMGTVLHSKLERYLPVLGSQATTPMVAQHVVDDLFCHGFSLQDLIDSIPPDQLKLIAENIQKKQLSDFDMYFEQLKPQLKDAIFIMYSGILNTQLIEHAESCEINAKELYEEHRIKEAIGLVLDIYKSQIIKSIGGSDWVDDIMEELDGQLGGRGAKSLDQIISAIKSIKLSIGSKFDETIQGKKEEFIKELRTRLQITVETAIEMSINYSLEDSKILKVILLYILYYFQTILGIGTISLIAFQTNLRRISRLRIEAIVESYKTGYFSRR